MQRLVPLILICIVAFGSMALAESEFPLIIEEDFSQSEVGEQPKGWVIAESGTSPDTPYVTDEVARSHARALRLGREPENDHRTNRVVLNFDALHERAIVSFWFQAVDTDRTLVLGIGGTSEGVNLFGASAGPFIVLRNAAVQSYSENVFVDVGLYAPGQWHKVTIDINIPESTYDVYMDDADEPGNLSPLVFR